MREWGYGSGLWSVWLVIMVVAVLGATVICLIVADLRVVAALMITHGLLVMTTPMWFLHYAGLTAAPMALTLGGALAAVLGWSRSVRWLAPTLVGLAVVGALALAYPMRHVELGQTAFSRRPLRGGVRRVGRLHHHRLADDLDPDGPAAVRHRPRLPVRRRPGRLQLRPASTARSASDARRLNEDWQALALDYYRSGEAVIAVRFDTDRGFSDQTAQLVDSWPVIVEADGYTVRRPRA